MLKLLLRWIILAVAIVLVGHIAKWLHIGFFTDADQPTDWGRLMLGAALLGFLNATLGTVLKLLTLPLQCLTLGLFSLVVNAVVLLIASQANLGFKATNFWAALFASIMIAIVSGLLNSVLSDDSKK